MIRELGWTLLGLALSLPACAQSSAADRSWVEVSNRYTTKQ